MKLFKLRTIAPFSRPGIVDSDKNFAEVGVDFITGIEVKAPYVRVYGKDGKFTTVPLSNVAWFKELGEDK